MFDRNKTRIEVISIINKNNGNTDNLVEHLTNYILSDKIRVLNEAKNKLNLKSKNIIAKEIIELLNKL